jgi:DNA helicase-2/ATP-dependent DNA helicase PcrA
MDGFNYNSKPFYRERFHNIVSALNSEQFEAVQNIEGPVMTIAGPGTGKTHILAARIGQILLQTDTLPQNILCLTFTDAGVLAMRKRLIEFIGPDAHRVNIYTFHSFCNKVIQENLDIFGYENLQAASELEIIDLIRSIIDELSPLHLLRKNNRLNPYKYESKLKNLFGKMKTEGWKFETLNKAIDAYILTLEYDEKYIYKRNGSGFKKGDLKTEEIKKEINNMEVLRSAASLFEKYDSKMLESSRYDYNDMILWVKNIFESPEYEHILRKYQEQYIYILADEFQDTNGAQNAVLMKLIDYWDLPNIFIVGDDDQSVFEFQGARLKNMMDFFDRYRNNMLMVVLGENYRSGQRILDAAKYVIDKNKLRIIKHLEKYDIGFKIDKKLISANPNLDQSSVQIALKEYPTRQQEEYDIISSIRILNQNAVPCNEIAIIYAKHRQASELIRLLESNGIPYQTKRNADILKTPLIRNIRTFFKYLLLEFSAPYSAEALVYELLHFEIFGIQPGDIAKLTAIIAKTNRTNYENSNYNYLTWRDLIKDDELLNTLSLEKKDAILKLSKLIDQILYALINLSLPELIEKFYLDSGLIDFISENHHKKVLLDTITTFFDFISEEIERDPNINLSVLLSVFDRMEENNLELGLVKSEVSENAVNLLTAHSSKGLEFEAVFMIHCSKDNWEPTNRNSGFQFSFPDNLSFANEETDSSEAARRLFYVAMTRAKTFLQISYHRQNSKAKELENCIFVDEMIAEGVVPFESINLTSDKIQKEQLNLFRKPELLTSAQLQKVELKYLLKDFTLSISALNAYLECPQSFYYQYVLKIPYALSADVHYGNAIHQTLKRIFELSVQKNELIGKEDALEIFKNEIDKRKIFFSEKTYNDLLFTAEVQLPEYLEQRKETFSKQLKSKVWTEKSFYNIRIRNVPVNGIIDKICFGKDADNDFLRIVDYKTGILKPDRFASFAKSKKGGAYFRQLLFYKLLVENSGTTDKKVKFAEIDFISPDDNNIFPSKTITLYEADCEKMEEIISEAYKNILNNNFSEACMKSTCKWCNFVKSQNKENEGAEDSEHVIYE